jgi:hypothetical protein
MVVEEEELEKEPEEVKKEGDTGVSAEMAREVESAKGILPEERI